MYKATNMGNLPSSMLCPDNNVPQQQYSTNESGGGGEKSYPAVTGTYIGQASQAECGSPTSLMALANSSEAIVTGTVLSNRAYLTRDGFGILTHYTVRVDTVIKGAMAPGQSVGRVVPGGRVGFPDATWAQLDLSGFLRPYDGESYVLFLRGARSLYGREPNITDDTYVPVFGPLGVYHQVAGVRIVPAGAMRTTVAKSLKPRFTPAEFVARIREEIGK